MTKISKYYKKSITGLDAFDLVYDAKKDLEEGRLEMAVERLDLAKKGFHVCIMGGVTNAMSYAYRTYHELRQQIKNIQSNSR
ncbi:hypothetical protein KW805_01530 [Candidatus Pacearchaeota archaeon]|nr:hypothetical protein [Candidatus Pacearchaeota archaeon]